jgi:prophage tail gpP-like protein
VASNTIGAAARTFCDPYGVGVVLPDGDAELPINAQYVSVTAGYSAYFVIEELARSVGMLVWDNEKGELVIGKGGTAGRAGSAIVEGINAERVDVVFSTDQRFARYKVLAQAPNLFDMHDNYVADKRDPDPRLLRNRLRVLPQELPDRDLQFSKQRALWKRIDAGGALASAGVYGTGAIFQWLSRAASVF